MWLRIALFGMIAVGVAGMAGVTLSLLPTAPTAVAPEPRPHVMVLVAASALRGGNLIKPQDLRAAEFARTDAPLGATLDGPQQRSGLIGAMIRRSLSEGQPILPEDIIRPGDHGFLAAVLRPGMRAATVGVDAVSGTAGLIWPGDQVDVVMTQALDDPSLPTGHRVAAQTVLSGVRVIAIDQQLVQGQLPEGAVAPPNRTATLEVTPAQVERILVAGRLGHLSLSVLSSEHPTDTAAAGAPARPGLRPGVTWGSDVSPALSNANATAPPVMMRVFQGNAESKDYHF